jgi:hypothetical protein
MVLLPRDGYFRLVQTLETEDLGSRVTSPFFRCILLYGEAAGQWERRSYPFCLWRFQERERERECVCVCVCEGYHVTSHQVM